MVCDEQVELFLTWSQSRCWIPRIRRKSSGIALRLPTSRNLADRAHLENAVIERPRKKGAYFGQ